MTLRRDVFLTYHGPHQKHTLLRAFLEDALPEILSKVGVLAERSMKKSKKHHAAALGGCGGLGQLWEALAELRKALGELWEGLYIKKKTSFFRKTTHRRQDSTRDQDLKQERRNFTEKRPAGGRIAPETRT